MKKKKKGNKKEISIPIKQEVIRTDTKNCLYCSSYFICKDIQKGSKHVCLDFHDLRTAELEQVPKKGKVSKKDKNKKEGKSEKTGKKKSSSKENFDIIIKNDKFKEADTNPDYDFIADVHRSIDSYSNSPLPCVEIDDSDAPMAMNIFEFMTSDEFMGFKAFPKQLQFCVELLGEWCPKCSDPKWVENGWALKDNDEYGKVKRHIQLLEHGSCPKCGTTRKKLIRQGLLMPYVEGCGVIGQRSGKSEISRQSFLYIQHKFLKLQRPSLIYPGITETSKLTFTVLAQTFAKAKRDLYDPLYSAYTQSNWFKNYHEILDHYGEKMGQELYRVKDTFASYRLQNIDVIPETPDTRNLRGATRAAAIMDELDWIDSSPDGDSKKGGKVRTDVEGIYTSVLNSFRTLRSGFDALITGTIKSAYDVNIIPPPLMLCVSSPSSAKSLMMRNLKLSETSRYIYGMNAATWEVNPLITKESLSDEFRKSETNAMRDFGAVPPNSSFPFIEYIEDLSAIATDYKNSLKLKPLIMETNSGAEMTTGKVIFRQARDNNNRILAIDAGSVDNSFCVSTGFWDEEEEEMICDGMIELIPTHENPINFNAVAANIIGTIIERMNITFVASDRWQSKKLLHDFEANFDIDTEEYSLKYSDFVAFKSDVYDGHFKIPKCEVKTEKIEDMAMGDYPFSFEGCPVAHFMHQCITVRDLGKEVLKGTGFTDDMFRSVVLLHSFISDHDYREYCTGVRVSETRVIEPALGVISSRGRPAGAIGAGGGGQAGGTFNASNGSILGIASSRRVR